MAVLGLQCSNCPDPAWVQQNTVVGNIPGAIPATPSSSGVVYPQIVIDCYNNGFVIYTNNDGITWENCRTSVGETVDLFTLTAGQITSGVTLSQTPTNPTNTDLKVRGFVIQTYGDDYTVAGNVLSFDANLQSALSVGDKIEVRYS